MNLLPEAIVMSLHYGKTGRCEVLRVTAIKCTHLQSPTDLLPAPQDGTKIKLCSLTFLAKPSKTLHLFDVWKTVVKQSTVPGMLWLKKNNGHNIVNSPVPQGHEYYSFVPFHTYSG